jgi:membrane complex biogenesis BtpA family protein
VFGRKCSVIGVVHVLPLPGAAGYKGIMQEVLAQAVDDAVMYKEEGVDAILVENMHDVPYLNGAVEPETTAAMALIAHMIKYETMIPVGIQILAGANIEALGAAVASDLDFMRVEGFVFAHVGDEGIHESCAGKLVRKRAQLKADHIKIFADIKKKHSSHVITGDVSIAETARAAEFFRADGLVITGTATGEPANVEDVKVAAAATDLPVLVGSGVTPENIASYYKHADAVIVGSTFKQDGFWRNQVDAHRVRQFMDKVMAVR